MENKFKICAITGLDIDGKNIIAVDRC